ncbi:MAG: hypothetical protein D6698_11360 [Gammaproteobacteria bacterium]|nr:MAG: hypothetical protein D6698_11360 [Gammaproteobacteria bacterium]
MTITIDASNLIRPFGAPVQDTLKNQGVRLIPFDFSYGNYTGLLDPIKKAGGIHFPYRPSITESNRARYAITELTHTNEGSAVYGGKETARINLGGGTWVADTVETGKYMMAVLHFFRSVTLMDYGNGHTGRPPTPCWFYAYEPYGYNGVPVLIESADISFPQDVEYMDIQLGGETLVLPRVFKIDSISLIVQHSFRYWLEEFSLDDFRSGVLLKRGVMQ